ncbi:MAG TPA: PEP-CTERM sorting domain-containing protein [Candidatus Xenobia bacterium]|jgi:hypothetical protein
MRHRGLAVLSLAALTLIGTSRPASAVPFTVTTTCVGDANFNCGTGEVLTFTLADTCTAFSHQLFTLTCVPGSSPTTIVTNFNGCFGLCDTFHISGVEVGGASGCLPLDGATTGFCTFPALPKCFSFCAGTGVFTQTFAFGTEDLSGDGDFTVTFTPTASAPEPSTVWLLGSLLPLAWMRRRRT